MLSGKVSAFTDPIEYQTAIRAADVTVVPTARGDFRSELSRVDFDRLWMQRFAESAPVVKFTAMHWQRSIIVFLTRPNQPDIHHGGVDVSPDDIAVYRLGASVHHRTSAPYRFGSMSLTPDDLAKTSYALLGCELTAPLDTHRMRPAPHLLARLRRLHLAAGRLAASSAEVLTHPEASRSLEEALTQAMIQCLAGGERLETDRRFRNHKAIMTRLEDFLGMHPNHPLYLSEICAATHASERTMRACCQEHLGMGPVRYLWLRRMYMARRALSLASEGAATVTSVAMANGFWELGRFSVAYRACSEKRRWRRSAARLTTRRRQKILARCRYSHSRARDDVPNLTA